MKWFAYFLTVIGLNAVPVWGWFTQGWNLGTTLAIYWCETVLSGLLIALRIWVHRRLTRKKGHFRSQVGGTVTVNKRPAAKVIDDFLVEFLVVILGFSFVQGIFIFVLVALLIPKLAGPAAAPNLANFRVGLTGVTLFLVVSFLLDLGSIRYRPFSWIRDMAGSAIGRVLVIQFAILIGLPAMAFLNQPRAVFAVFAFLKFLGDLGAYIPQSDSKDEPPAWLANLASRFPGAKPGEFSEYWRNEQAKEQKQREEDEEVLAGPDDA